MLDKTYLLQAIELINDYIRQNNLELKDYMNFELGLQYFDIICKVKKRGCSFIRQNSNIYLRFTPPNETRNKYSCNEFISKDGCINALAKSLAVIDHLNKFDKVSEFWAWYDEHIKEVKIVENDIITVKTAIEKVKKSYFDGQHNGIDRDNPEFKILKVTIKKITGVHIIK